MATELFSSYNQALVQIESGIYHAAVASQCDTRRMLYRLSYAGPASLNEIMIIQKFNYRPQRSCVKVIFSQACVKNSVHRGVSALVHAGIHPPGRHPPPWADTTPSGRHPPPPGQTPPPPLPPVDSYCSGRYASYWNAFLFLT